MKKYLFVAFLLLSAGLGTAGAQSFSTGVNDQKKQPTKRPIPPISKPGEIGALPRAIRGGNPLQMVNPGAPQRYYGPPEDTVVTEEDLASSHRTRVTGLILVGILW